MNRSTLLGAVGMMLAVGAFLALGRQAPVPAAVAPAMTDSVWYHASDVALLARTGRPQLVEFFHPD